MAERLELTSAMVRRYQLAYEKASGQDLPRNPATRSRLMSEAQAAIFEKARNMVRERDDLSVEDAMQQALAGTEPPPPPAPEEKPAAKTKKKTSTRKAKPKKKTTSKKKTTAKQAPPSPEDVTLSAPLREKIDAQAEKLKTCQDGYKALKKEIDKLPETPTPKARKQVDAKTIRAHEKEARAILRRAKGVISDLEALKGEAAYAPSPEQMKLAQSDVDKLWEKAEQLRDTLELALNHLAQLKPRRGLLRLISWLWRD